MNLDPKALASAALDSMAHLETTVLFEVDCAIAENNCQRVWTPAMIEQFAALDLANWGMCRSRMVAKFGSALSVRVLDGAINDARRRLRRPAPERNGNILPGIQINNIPLRDQAENSLLALRAVNDPPTIFIRSGEMVTVGTDERQQPKIIPVSADHLRGRLDRCANYQRSNETQTSAAAPPLDVVRDIMALPPLEWGIPALDVLVEIPTLRVDGTLLDKPGYDAQSRTYYSPDPSLQMRPIPDDPTTDEVQDAVDLIDEAIEGFPFCPGEDGAPSPSRANFFGLLLTPIIRPAISGCTPICLIDAPNAGTGKSLLAGVFSVITAGRPASMIPCPRDDNEMAKLIGATLLQGRSQICFDNVEGVLASPVLALALTAEKYETRILGVSENMVAANRATWIATGNNIRPAGDMPRRCYPIRIDAQSSQPYRGRKFLHSPLLDWVGENRSELLRSLLIMARAWYSHDKPSAVTSPLGSFEEWHETVGGILHGAGVKGFLENLSGLAETDDNLIQWEIFLEELYAHFDDPFTPRDIVDVVRGATQAAPSPFTLPDTMADVDRRREGILERALTRSFGKRAGTRLGAKGWHLIRTQDKIKHTPLWSVGRSGG